MYEQTAGNEQQEESDDGDDNHHVEQKDIVAEDVILGIDDGYAPAKTSEGATGFVGTLEGLVEHVTIDTIHTDELIACLARHHGLDRVAFGVVVVLGRELEGVLIEERTIGEHDELALLAQQHTEGVGRGLALEHDLREHGERHIDIEGADDLLSVVDRQTEGGQGLTLVVVLRLYPTREVGIDRHGVGVPVEMGADDVGVVLYQALGVDLHLLRLMDVVRHAPIHITCGLFHVVEHVVDAVHSGFEGLGRMTEGFLLHRLTREVEHDE